MTAGRSVTGTRRRRIHAASERRTSIFAVGVLNNARRNGIDDS